MFELQHVTTYVHTNKGSKKRTIQ